VMFGKWKKIADGYGKMVLGYFGHTPCEPDSKVVKLASEQLKLKPTKENAIDIADRDESKSLKATRKILKSEGIAVTDENVFIAAACKEKGIAFLKGQAKVNVRKISQMPKEQPCTQKSTQSGRYSVVVNGSRYNVEVSEGFNDSVQVKSITEVAAEPAKNSSKSSPASHNGDAILSSVPGVVHKILIKAGDKVKKGQAIVVLEAMKMEIEVPAPKDGTISSIEVKQGQNVESSQVIARM